jgi:uncharacterized coiled-coil DUF342 family protein
MIKPLISEESLNSKLTELSARWELLSQDLDVLARLPQLVAQLQSERDSLRQEVEQLRAERDKLRTERNHLLHAWADEHISEEELDRRSKEPGGCSLAEIWARLEKL